MGEHVVGDDRRNGGEQAGRGRNQGLGDSRGDGAQGGGAGVAQPLKCVNDAPDSAEQPDKRGNGAGGGQPGQAALQARQLFGRGDLCGALDPDDVEPRALAAKLAFVRKYFSESSSNTGTSGLGLNWSETAIRS